MKSCYLLSYLALVLLLTNLVLVGRVVTLWKQIRLVPAEIFVVEEYRPADIEVDSAVSKGTLKPFWQSFAQGGEEMGGNMLAPTVDSMRQLSPGYIRLDHIFDDDYYGVVKSPGDYDFSRLDGAVDQILAMGAKPFFSLGYMPGSLAETKISAPYNWDDWFNLVKATVEHYSGKNGRNIANVYYEVWNEPDLEAFGAWQRGGDKNYLTLYSVSARAAAGAANTNRFYIGGPSTTGLYRNWVIDLINFAASNKLRLDFISWHRYSFSPQRFAMDMEQAKSWLRGSRYQLIISEWGPTPEKSSTYSTTYASAHAFASIRQMIDAADGIYAFEIKDGPEQGNQGWGILTHQSAELTRKPRFTAFSWLKNAWGSRLEVTGEGTNVTGWAIKRDKNIIDLYLVNFAPKQAKKETVPIRFINLKPGEFQVNQTYLVNGSLNSQVIASTITGRLFITLRLPVNEVVQVRVKQIKVMEQSQLEPVEEATGFGKLVR